ncbi:DUF4127 family protein [Deinococcus roseus]|uniref:DUF4127 family protein n=1 Tax=Deinococcus roseus TaxID=392414 RepID=A0ABQ2D9P2_9DEIO|nr:DUF4127 family protein [Deinococcus roseus]GGJ50870.1 hypothetical protein GCM10008938_41100 [Deinococcus roseus]
MKPLLISALLLSSVASAQVALLPLDSRPVNRIYPEKLAALKNKETRILPWYRLGRGQTSGDIQEIHDWILRQTDAEVLIVALDSVAYGGLVQSRTLDLPPETAVERLQVVREWQHKTGKPVYASITIPRYPDAKFRERNLTVIREMMQWAKAGAFKDLRVTWDDAVSGSPAVKEAEALKPLLAPNIKLYPGADEVGAALVTSYLSPEKKTVKILFSDPSKASTVIKYDGLPLIESVKLHAGSVGFEVTEGDADLTLFVFNGSATDPRFTAVALNHVKGPLSVVDVNRVNQGTVRLWKDLTTLGRTQQLMSLSGWGTPGNNLGTALSHAKLALSGVDPEKQQETLAYEYANDVLFSALLRPDIRAHFQENQMGSKEAWEYLQKVIPELKLFSGYVVKGAGLPWDRSFEWEFAVEKAVP